MIPENRLGYDFSGIVAGSEKGGCFIKKQPSFQIRRSPTPLPSASPIELCE
ncbi:hypothetical protein DSO57_1004516 [Entomophthora muscae]|uniref:Uncharacterized protein n=1 Tax=Entomophthora muscae TaxID=34485 RepID=A0ACC2RMU3_9FUNG|nr:hypothetical protein DSO57_1004516 [Entomophthora muscae]